MLKKILSPESCAKCRLCCGFTTEDIWEIPIITGELKEKILSDYLPDASFEKRGNEYAFSMEFTEMDADGLPLGFCPALTDTGCLLKNDKPFDCKIWPFRVMRISDDMIGITMSMLCEAMADKPIKELCSFLDEENSAVADMIFDYAKKHPDIIKPLAEGYPVLKGKRVK